MRLKEDSEDASSELGKGGYRLHFLDETSRIVLLSDPIFKVGLFAFLLHISFLGFGWRRVAINSGPKNPKDLLKKRACQVIYSQFGLAIHQNDHQARRRIVEWAQNEIAVVPDFHKRVLFNDEAFFWFNGYVNKQNCRIWREANSQVYVETPLHPEKLTIWCALWAGGIIGPYFFKNDEGHNGTVNGDRYRAMITNFFIPEFNNHDVQELWFQKDGATCHTARTTINLLKDTFEHKIMLPYRSPCNFIQGDSKQRGQTYMIDQSCKKDQKSYMNIGSQTPVEGARATRGRCETNTT
ncbi:uncharacterized protein TNCV_1838121 [Trichonephila clavipes]|nr:uncharacterized protein TNCV_1838121 [Trichonephila clavipes]